MSQGEVCVSWTLGTTDKILGVQSSVCVAEWGIGFILLLKSLFKRRKLGFILNHLGPESRCFWRLCCRCICFCYFIGFLHLYLSSNPYSTLTPPAPQHEVGEKEGQRGKGAQTFLDYFLLVKAVVVLEEGLVFVRVSQTTTGQIVTTATRSRSCFWSALPLSGLWHLYLSRVPRIPNVNCRQLGKNHAPAHA